jgi:hypothetical protein
MHGRDGEMHAEFYLGYLKGRYHFEDVGVDLRKKEYGS